jgi:hypothetical protein
MVCSFICPVEGLITFKEMPKDWNRREAKIMDNALEKELKLEPYKEINLL